jgi:iron(II)-dependent oxidoreductase
LGDERDLDELVTVPAGPFLMGSSATDEMAQADEKPQHKVRLPAFKIGKYPVTNARYLHFVQATGRTWRSDAGRRADRANHPAVYVSWHDAQAYCAWLTRIWQAEGKIAVDEVVRLPSEAQWEKAARGGLPSPSEGEELGPVPSEAEGERVESRIYPWGDEWDETMCNTSELGLGETCAVGMFPKGASPYGCLDMAGNVWERTISLWGESYLRPDFKYPYNPTDGRENLDAGDEVLRVVRGGSWSYLRDWVRCAFRFGLAPLGGDLPFLAWGSLGFRIVVSPISPPSAL